MTSIDASTRQISNDSSHFITIAAINNQIFTSPFGSVAPWASVGSAASSGGIYASTLLYAGALLKDMGTRIISSGTYFRKVQLVVPTGSGYVSSITDLTKGNIAQTGGASTFGVAGPATNGGVPPDFLTGYIKLGFDGFGQPAPVAKFGR